MNYKVVVAREWLWFVGCFLIAAVFANWDRTAAMIRVRDLIQVEVALFFYTVTGTIRLTVWAIRKMATRR